MCVCVVVVRSVPVKSLPSGVKHGFSYLSVHAGSKFNDVELLGSKFTDVELQTH